MRKQDDEISFATSKKNMLKFKLVFIGDQAVGKSSIITRFIKDQFDPTHNPTVGIDFVSKNINVSGTIVRLQLWDTAGQERFRSLIPGYLRDCQAAFIVFDITLQQSFQSIHKWIDFVKQSRGDDALIYVIANKADLTQNKYIETQQSSIKVKQWGCKYFQVSAKTGANLDTVFKQVCADLLNTNEKAENISIELQKSKVIQKIITGQAERKVIKKQQNQQRKSKLMNPNKPGARRIKQKNCC